MEIVRGLDALPRPNGSSVVTVGFFDGVHLGHRSVFARVVEAARATGRRSVVVTFDRHPREILTPGNEPKLLTTLERKASLIERTGIDELVVLAFTEGFSRWPPEEFVRRVLADGLAAEHLLVGGNFTFGHKALGTLATLQELGPVYGFTAEGVPLLEIEGRPVSSSSIREALAAGELDWPHSALGRHYDLDGIVVTGAGRGVDLGFPTANLRTDPRILLPGIGIYAGLASTGGASYGAAISVGTNPTFGMEPAHVEAHLLDFEGELHGERLAVEFWARIRDEERFESPESLVMAMAEDVRATRKLVEAEGGRPA